jgi:hypothetical protein
MGRNLKFAFSLSGRKSAHSNDRKPDSTQQPSHAPSDSSAGLSKAERLLGTSGLPTSPPLRSRLSNLTSTGQDANEASARDNVQDSKKSFHDYSDKTEAIGDLYGSVPRKTSSRASSSVLGRPYAESTIRSGSVTSFTSRQIHHQDSTSTLRSHYDAQKSPLSISQQTSASAVRDRALRKGHPEVAVNTTQIQEHDGNQREQRGVVETTGKRSKPPRLDLSRLFPKPRSQNDSDPYLLSPSKVMRSPSQLSAVSEYFPRNASTTKPKSIRSMLSTDSVRLSRSAVPPLPSRDPIDHAKVNIRKPPQGEKHWFEGLLEESDEDEEDPNPFQSRYISGLEKGSASRNPTQEHPSGRSRYEKNAGFLLHEATFAAGEYTRTEIPRVRRPASPSQQSISSRTTAVSNKTRASHISSVDLRSASVLSMSSSSEDEEPSSARLKVRDSTNADNEEEIIVGRAQAFEIKPRRKDNRSTNRHHENLTTSRASLMTTSTGSGTIEMVYSPVAQETFLHPTKPPRSRRSNNHKRYPSSIPEDRGGDDHENTNLMTSSKPASKRPVIASGELHEQHRLMAVTEEEEALLEMMRRKRAAMAKDNLKEGSKLPLQQNGFTKSASPQQTAVLQRPRTSGFLIMDDSTTDDFEDSIPQPPKSARAWKAKFDCSPPLQPRYIYAANSASSQEAKLRLRTPISIPPLDVFPSPTHTNYSASAPSPTSASHASPLPSPATPIFRIEEEEMEVKVAGSNSSLNGDEEVVIPSTAAESMVLKDASSDSHLTESVSAKAPSVRPRTASSGADMAVNAATTLDNKQEKASQPTSPFEIKAAVEGEMRPRSASVKSFPKSKRTSAGAFHGQGHRGSRNSLNPSLSSKDAPLSPESVHFPITPGSNGKDKFPSSPHGCSRGCNCQTSKRTSFTPSVHTRCSVSEDVLAAWGSLGGFQNYDQAKLASG